MAYLSYPARTLSFLTPSDSPYETEVRDFLAFAAVYTFKCGSQLFVGTQPVLYMDRTEVPETEVKADADQIIATRWLSQHYGPFSQWEVTERRVVFVCRERVVGDSGAAKFILHDDEQAGYEPLILKS